ncbi:hypothetical protein SUDANB145_05213 [Streptomyces sp. enrichment culture]|uniref:hypothetical protein n=1 Tax=Streptomyces sp. enrichment culture TaxID=1795815 RepID=UPI003F549BC9
MFGTDHGQDRGTDGPQGHDARGGTARAVSPVRVFIGLDGRTTVDDVPFPVPDGEPVHVAVLDVLHRRARARGAAVEAVILDRERNDVTLVEVAPDGSSRVLLHESHGATPETEDGPASGPPPVGASDSGPVPADAAERPAASVDTVDPQVVAAPTAGVVPEELAELVGLVRHSLDTGALERAAALAFRLREHTTRTFGPEHSHTLEALALEAYAAHRSGNPRLAMTTCLELARTRHRQGDPRAGEELTRATVAWLRMDDVPSAVDHGRALLDTLLAVRSARDAQGAQGATVPDAALPRLVNRRMRELTEETETRATGAA